MAAEFDDNHGQDQYAWAAQFVGGGLYIAGTRNGARITDACGAFATVGTGQTVPVAGTYCNPGTISRTGQLARSRRWKPEPLYNPNEAEEVITATWTTLQG